MFYLQKMFLKKIIKKKNLNIMKTLKLFPELDKNNNEYVELATQVNIEIADHLCKNRFVVSDLAKKTIDIIEILKKQKRINKRKSTSYIIGTHCTLP